MTSSLRFRPIRILHLAHLSTLFLFLCSSTHVMAGETEKVPAKLSLRSMTIDGTSIEKILTLPAVPTDEASQAAAAKEIAERLSKVVDLGKSTSSSSRENYAMEHFEHGFVKVSFFRDTGKVQMKLHASAFEKGAVQLVELDKVNSAKLKETAAKAKALNLKGVDVATYPPESIILMGKSPGVKFEYNGYSDKKLNNVSFIVNTRK